MRPRVPDVALPAALAALAVAELAALDLLRAVAVACFVGSAAVLVLRRVAPWPSATAAQVLITLPPFFGVPLDEPASPILLAGVASYTLGRRLPDLRGVLSMLLLLGLIVGDYTVHPGAGDLSDAVFVLAVLVPPYGAGLVMRSLAERNERLRMQAEELLRLQEQVRQEAAAAERRRIARELHDVIAHSVSAMVVQAAAAEDLVTTDPARASEVLREVSGTGRKALVETGRLLHLLRDDAELGLSPGPGMARLPELVDDARRSGLEVELAVDGTLDDLPPGVDLSAFRVVQEALTNARKHGDGRAALRVARTDRAVTVEVENPVSRRSGDGSGLGLVGVGERVAVVGGRLRCGADDGLWVLRAELPLS